VGPLQVQAHWDAAAEVWWAESNDLPGLATEAPSFSELIIHIRSLAPTIIQENLGRRPDGLSIRVAGDASEKLSELMADFGRDLRRILRDHDCEYRRPMAVMNGGTVPHEPRLRCPPSYQEPAHGQCSLEAGRYRQEILNAETCLRFAGPYRRLRDGEGRPRRRNGHAHRYAG
jgi:Domain of unknown function (DUF1902)